MKNTRNDSPSTATVSHAKQSINSIFITERRNSVYQRSNNNSPFPPSNQGSLTYPIHAASLDQFRLRIYNYCKWGLPTEENTTILEEFNSLVLSLDNYIEEQLKRTHPNLALEDLKNEKATILKAYFNEDYTQNFGPLHLAVSLDSKNNLNHDVINYLVSQNTNVNSRDVNGNTPAHIAAINLAKHNNSINDQTIDTANTIGQLASHGADVYSLNNNGQTVVQIFEQNMSDAYRNKLKIDLSEQHFLDMHDSFRIITKSKYDGVNNCTGFITVTSFGDYQVMQEKIEATIVSLKENGTNKTETRDIISRLLNNYNIGNHTP